MSRSNTKREEIVIDTQRWPDTSGLNGVPFPIRERETEMVQEYLYLEIPTFECPKTSDDVETTEAEEDDEMRGIIVIDL